jgi:hypothetical protein
LPRDAGRFKFVLVDDFSAAVSPADDIKFQINKRHAAIFAFGWRTDVYVNFDLVVSYERCHPPTTFWIKQNS